MKSLAVAVSEIFEKKSFPDAKVGGGAGGTNTICSRPEVADDVISGTDVDTFRFYACVNLWVYSFSGFRKNLNQPFM